MLPSKFAPKMPYPEHTAPDDVPAFAVERKESQRAVLWHPSQDPRHENVVLTVRRYHARGWTALIVTTREDFREASELTLPVTRRAA